VKLLRDLLVNRSETNDAKPFGSSFFHNSARATWYIKPTENTATSVTLGVFCRKHNLVAMQQPFAVSASFQPGKTTFTLADITEAPEFAPKLSIGQKVRAILHGGAHTFEEITQERLPAKPESVRRAVDREIKEGPIARFPNADGIERIGLVRRAS
jgi:hypothetical protein